MPQAPNLIANVRRCEARIRERLGEEGWKARSRRYRTAWIENKRAALGDDAFKLWKRAQNRKRKLAERASSLRRRARNEQAGGGFNK